MSEPVVGDTLERLVLPSITAGGVVLGLVAKSSSWRTSAVSHVALNTVATCTMLLARGLL